MWLKASLQLPLISQTSRWQAVRAMEGAYAGAACPANSQALTLVAASLRVST